MGNVLQLYDQDRMLNVVAVKSMCLECETKKNPESFDRGGVPTLTFCLPIKWSTENSFKAKEKRDSYQQMLDAARIIYIVNTSCINTVREIKLCLRMNEEVGH